MRKLNLTLLFAALSSGVLMIGACGSTAPDTVSIKNVNAVNANTVVVVNTPANAPVVENANPGNAGSSLDNRSVKPANSTADRRQPPPTDQDALSDPTVGGKIGVPECDEYLTKYEACLRTKVPEAERGALLSPLEKMRKGWQTAATNQTAKAALPGGCKVALATAKESLAKYSCDW